MGRTESAPEEALAAAGISTVSLITRIPGAHRNRVWEVRAAGHPTALILKIQAHATGEQTVAHEADVLRRLQPLRGLPVFHFAGTAGVSDTPFLITRMVPGAPLASWLASSPASGAELFTELARWLQVFSQLTGATELLRSRAARYVGPWSPCYSPGAAPAVVDTEQATDAGRNRLALVHGSFDPRNILISDRIDVAAVDLEATRLGSAFIDIASLALHLVMWQRVDLAVQWLTAASLAWSLPSLARDVLPYLLAQDERRNAARHLQPGISVADSHLLDELSDWARR